MIPYTSIFISIRHLNIKMVYNLILMLIQQISNDDLTKKVTVIEVRSQTRMQIHIGRGSYSHHILTVKRKRSIPDFKKIATKRIIYAWRIHINLIRSALYLHQLLIEDLNQNGFSQFSQNWIPLENSGTLSNSCKLYFDVNNCREYRQVKIDSICIIKNGFNFFVYGFTNNLTNP